jgi:hypothetical protein
MKKFKELREHSLEEKLKASDPAGTYINDFVHSDNPKFEGKSKSKRIQMALAASYAAKGKSKNEEVESVEEAANAAQQAAIAINMKKQGKTPKKMFEEIESVEEGVMNAVKNLAKKANKALTGGSDEDQRKDLQRKMGVPQTGKKPMKEGTVSEKFYDEEGEMVSAQLRSIIAKANAMLAKLSDDTELEAWVQAEVTTAEDSITCVHDHLMYGKDTTE